MTYYRCRCDLEKELNNANSMPGELFLGTSGVDISREIEFQYAGGFCDFPEEFYADVIIRVYTASLINNTLTLDPNPYYQFDDEIQFRKGNPFSSEAPNIFLLRVPEVGAYGYTMEIRPRECSDCCKDRDGTRSQGSTPPDPRCDGNFVTNRCPTGRPTLILTKIYSSENRPKDTSRQFPLTINTTEFSPGLCRGCGSCPITNCI